VLDLNLPKNGGLEVLRAIRKTQDLATLPVVIVSSSASPQDLAKTQSLGVERYITKPPDLEGFLQTGQIFREILMASRIGTPNISQSSSVDK
jgi:CheY-like chemotaxis protein